MNVFRFVTNTRFVMGIPAIVLKATSVLKQSAFQNVNGLLLEMVGNAFLNALRSKFEMAKLVIVLKVTSESMVIVSRFASIHSSEVKKHASQSVKSMKSSLEVNAFACQDSNVMKVKLAFQSAHLVLSELLPVAYPPNLFVNLLKS